MPVKIGQVIEVKKAAEGRSRKKEKYTVTEIYPNCILTLDKNGHRRSFSVGDLVINKIISMDEKLR